MARPLCQAIYIPFHPVPSWPRVVFLLLAAICSSHISELPVCTMKSAIYRGLGFRHQDVIVQPSRCFELAGNLPLCPCYFLDRVVYGVEWSSMKWICGLDYLFRHFLKSGFFFSLQLFKSYLKISRSPELHSFLQSTQHTLYPP